MVTFVHDFWARKPVKCVVNRCRLQVSACLCPMIQRPASHGFTRVRVVLVPVRDCSLVSSCSAGLLLLDQLLEQKIVLSFNTCAFAFLIELLNLFSFLKVKERIERPFRGSSGLVRESVNHRHQTLHQVSVDHH